MQLIEYCNSDDNMLIHYLFYVTGKSKRICRSSHLRRSNWAYMCSWCFIKLFKSLLFDSAQFLGACFRFALFCLFGLAGNLRYFLQTSQWLSRNMHICSAHCLNHSDKVHKKAAAHVFGQQCKLSWLAGNKGKQDACLRVRSGQTWLNGVGGGNPRDDAAATRRTSKVVNLILLPLHKPLSYMPSAT